MGKSHTKRKKAAKAPRAKPKPARPKFEEDLPALLTASDLGRIVDLSHQTILNMRTDPHAPPLAPNGKFPREPWLRYISNVKIYGRRAVKQMDPTELPPVAATGSVTPPGAEPSAADIDKQAEIDARASTATTPAELVVVSDKRLVKLKMAEEVITRRLANQERRGRLVPRQAVEELIYGRAQRALSLAKKIQLELPPKLIGLDRPEMERKLAETFEAFFTSIAMLGDPVTTNAAPEPVQPEPAKDAKTEQSGDARGG